MAPPDLKDLQAQGPPDKEHNKEHTVRSSATTTEVQLTAEPGTPFIPGSPGSPGVPGSPSVPLRPGTPSTPYNKYRDDIIIIEAHEGKPSTKH